MEVGSGRGRMAYGIDHDDLGPRFGQPMLVRMRRRGRGVRSPDHDAGRIGDRLGVEAGRRAAVKQGQGLVPGLVADAVRVHLARAESVEKTHRKPARQQGAGAGVVGMDQRFLPTSGFQSLQALGDLGQGILPGYRLEAALAFRADAAQRLAEARRLVAPDTVVGQRAFPTERAAGNRMIRVAQHLAHPAVALDDRDPTRVVAVARTGGLDHLLIGHRPLPSQLFDVSHDGAEIPLGKLLPPVKLAPAHNDEGAHSCSSSG